ncbi:hypothetical protein N5C67_20655 [Comamonas thiooxydans]|uniref:hypothetical protein n=1 Tax=Comamonas thiooxydans TaxID=363952 RepID=UPI002446BD01|nr:hypothetical protein [Comamonas thiooxydans]MDH1255065.1 hypothetical protein [Comamonas thiooxydans]
MKQPETCEISQTADSHKVDELTMLVRQLVHSLRKASPGNDLADRALDYLKRHGLAGTFLRGNSAFVPENVPVGVKPSKAPEAVGTLPSAGMPKNVPALTEQDAALLAQAASMLEGLQSDERNRGNCSTAEGAGCSAHAVRRLASSLLQAGIAAQPVRCTTCNDHGMIGGPSFYDPGEGGQPCPDCEVRHRNGLAAGDLMAWATEVGGNRIAENVVEMTRDDLQRLIAERAPLAQAGARDAAFEAVRQKFCKLQRYSFLLDDKGNVRRTPDYSGNWVEFEAVHTLFEPAAVDAAIAAQPAQGGD